jgi:hypothetical protein
MPVSRHAPKVLRHFKGSGDGFRHHLGSNLQRVDRGDDLKQPLEQSLCNQCSETSVQPAVSVAACAEYLAEKDVTSHGFAFRVICNESKDLLILVVNS